MQDVFAESVDGMGLQTLEAGETELNRLRKLKLEKMGELVLASRARIQGKGAVPSPCLIVLSSSIFSPK